ncbi:hypothetical protein CWI84_05535 [Idiomarina tyrosinivorans]|uniref:Adhesin domain-containing protein n=1 Tax=Idiomarina tyrosinivorans TaxID=1445662 RepID=A0A432ZRI8_9GAMM|nr:hypothetical protein [Idiomarina tyrosinivorans]RUO80520.1 hypothetical protein CWI84_05535 [Idiomarina tyrosinivorans]
MKKIIVATAFALIAGVTLMSAAMASPWHDGEQHKTISREFTVQPNTAFSLDSGVGEVQFRYHDKNTVEVQLVIESDDDSWLTDGDIEDIELTVDQTADELALSTNEQEDVKFTWTITMPQMSNVDIDFGVGEISGDIRLTDVDIDLGVGEIDLHLLGGDVGRVEANAGIGDTKIRGINSENTRAMISSQSESHSNGAATVRADVGVGDITLDFDQR